MKRILNKLRTKDAKVLLENFVSLSALQLVGLILPLITLPYILRVLEFERYGAIVMATSLIAYFQSVTDYSFRITATRDISVFRGNEKKVNLIFSKVIIIKSIFLIISILLILLIIFFYKPFYNNRIVFYNTIPLLIGYTIFPEWFFQGIERMKYITYLNLGIKIFFTVCVFVFIHTKEDYWKYPLFQSLGYIFAGLVGQYILFKKYKVRFVFIKIKYIKEAIRSNFPIFINQFLPTLYNNTSLFLLGLFSGNVFAGIYNAINSVVNLGSTVIEILSRVFFPFLNRNKNVFNKFKNIVFYVSGIIFLLLVVGSKIIIWYLHLSYDHSYLIIWILAFGLVGYSMYNLFGINYFIVHRLDKIVMWNTINSSIIGFLLAIPLIYYFNIIGAALTLCISRWLMGGGLMIRYYLLKRSDL